MKKLIFLGCLTAISLVVILTPVAATIAGPHKLMFPGVFGFHEMAPNIFVPAHLQNSKQSEVLSIAHQAEDVVSSYFGHSYRRPTVVICPEKKDCDPVFGRKDTQGVAYGKRVVRLNGKGINTKVAAHEFSHIALKNRVGEWRAYFGAIPAWFDEGLAVLVSGDTRYSKSVDEKVLTALQETHSWRDWNYLVKKHGWREVYGGAEILVAEIEKKIGKRGILNILDRVGEGEPFTKALEDELDLSSKKS